MEQFQAMLLPPAERSLPETHRELRAETMKFGKQTDDQTMLLFGGWDKSCGRVTTLSLSGMAGARLGRHPGWLSLRDSGRGS